MRRKVKDPISSAPPSPTLRSIVTSWASLNAQDPAVGDPAVSSLRVPLCLQMSGANTELDTDKIWPVDE